MLRQGILQCEDEIQVKKNEKEEEEEERERERAGAGKVVSLFTSMLESGVTLGGEAALEEVTMGHTWVSWVVNIGCGAGSLLSCPVCSHD